MRNLTRATALMSSALMLVAAPLAGAQTGAPTVDESGQPQPAPQPVPTPTPTPEPDTTPMPDATPQADDSLTPVDEASGDGGVTATPDAGEANDSDPVVEPKR